MDEYRARETEAQRRARVRAALAAHPMHDIPPRGTIYRFGNIHRDRASLTGYRMEFGKRTRAAVLKLRDIPGAERRFVVLARPRSGSTLLVDLLRQVDGMRCDGEVLHFAVRKPAKLLAALAQTCVYNTAYGCKVLSYQMSEVQRMPDPLAFLEELMARGFKLVHLRRNTFSQSLSLSKAQETGVYVSWQGGPARQVPPELDIDEDTFRHQLEWNAAMLSYEDLLMSAVPHERVQYETDLSTPDTQQATVDRICAMIGHPSGTVAARTVKTSGKTETTLVRNQHRLRDIATEIGID